jgi:hypothetical protein
MTARLPIEAQRFFWDTDSAQLDVDEYPVYVLERLLEYGDLPYVRWMLQRFPREEIIAILQTSCRLSPLSANFWTLYFGLDQDKIPCLSKPSLREPDAIWPY